jgi:ribonucleoside-diphosphate reductase beta chain
MAERQAWDLAFDPATGRRLRQDEVKSGRILPSSRWPNFFSRLVAKLQWDANAIDLKPDAEAWPGLPDERRERLTALLAGFRIADDAVSEHLAPFGQAANDSLVAWVIFLQRRDEQRHAQFFDRVAAEVLGLPGDTKDERRAAARELAPAGMLELFEERLPAMSAELAEGRVGLSEGMALYHMTLEGMVLSAGQRALLVELEDGRLPGVHEGVRRVELDERWHIGFGLRCLIDARPSHELIDTILSEAEEAAAAWGDALPAEIRDMIVPMARRRLAVITKQLDTRAAAA